MKIIIQNLHSHPQPSGHCDCVSNHVAKCAKCPPWLQVTQVVTIPN